MNELDIAYLAGFIDADGTISVARRKRRIGYYHEPYVSIANCDRPVLEWFRELIGKGTISNKYKSNQNHNWRDQYDIKWRNDDALYVSGLCYPYLHIKKDRAELLIEKWKLYTPRNGKYTEEMLKNKEWLVSRMYELNRRGIKETTNNV